MSEVEVEQSFKMEISIHPHREKSMISPTYFHYAASIDQWASFHLLTPTIFVKFFKPNPRCHINTSGYVTDRYFVSFIDI